MKSVVKGFGSAVDGLCETNPERARGLLRLGYNVKKFQYEALPGKSSKAERLAAIATTESMIEPLKHPESSVIVSLFHSLRNASCSWTSSVFLRRIRMFSFWK